MPNQLLQKLQRLETDIRAAIAHAPKQNEHQGEKKEKPLYDYKANKAAFYQSSINGLLLEIQKEVRQLPHDEDASVALFTLARQLGAAKQDYPALLHLIQLMKAEAEDLSSQQKGQPLCLLPKLPLEIQEDMATDAKELDMCFRSGCYRSAVILCARLLETALHRKYYDVIGKDILETSPGIGLGTLVAKLAEHNVAFDPGLTQQIHLINNVRIFSVHKKQQAFLPTKEQAQAIILFTMDSIKKLF